MADTPVETVEEEPEAPPPERDLNALITRTGIAAWSIVGAAVLIWIVLQVLIRFDILLAPIVLSVALIYILNPVVNWLSNRRVPRIIGAFLAFMLMLAVIAGIGLAVTPLVADQGSELANRFPEIYEDSVAEIEDLARSLGFEDVDIGETLGKRMNFVDMPTRRRNDYSRRLCVHDLDNIIEVAATGVDYVSIGALTKHLRAIDFSLRYR